MKCEIRTVISLEDKDLLELVEKCKEKHRLAELIEKALTAYCYQGAKAPESKREVPKVSDGSEELSRELRSLSAQLAVLSNNVQSNHSYVMEAVGRLNGVLSSAGRFVPVVGVQEQAAPDYEGAEEIREFPAGTEEVVEEPAVAKVEEELSEHEQVKPERPDKAKEHMNVEEPPKAEEEELSEAEDEEEGLSEETAALMAQFLGA